MSFEPKDPNYAERVRASFARQQAMAYLGAELAEVRPGFSEIRLECRPELRQQHGYMHGGIVGAIIDSAGGYASYSLMPADASVLTVEYKLNFLAPAEGEEIIARGEVLRSGRNLTITRADAYAVKDGTETLCATSLQTLMTMHGRPDT